MRPRVPHLVPLLPFLSLIASSQAAPTSDGSSFATDSSSVILPASAAGQSEAPSTSSVASSSSPSYLASSTESSGSSTSTLASVASVESYSPPVTTSAAAASSGAVTVTVTETVTAVSAAPTATAFSPPFYPTPETQGEGAWADAVAKAKSALSSWTVEQKVNLTTGVGWQNGRCVGNIAAQPDVGFPGLCLEDAPLGVRFADFVSVFPAGVNAAATFDRDLMRARGLAIAQEHRGKGVNVALGPGVNLARLSQAGRSWEMAGADPFLAGEVAYETIKGMQTPGKGVQACVKHYIGNELERNRTEASSNIDDRTMHELYLHPFLRAVQADVASVMCSYNQINGSWACQNSKTQNDLLKTELGFQGYIMSDWQATESGVSAVLAGLDMSMPGDIVFGARTPSGELSTYFGHNLTAAVSNGSVPLERVDDMATRILSAWYLLEQDGEYPEVNFDFRNTNNPDTNEHVDVQDDHYKLIRQIGAASTVLLKNDNGALPLGGLRTIALIGDDAGPSSRGPNGYADRGGLDGTLAQGWGSGTAEYPYLISPLEAIQSKARENRTTVSWFLNNYDLAGAATAAAYKDVALVFIAADSGEGYITVDGNEGDRKNLTAWANGDELVLATAAVNNNTIVVVHSVGPIIMEPWIEHPNVTAVVWAGLPGQESGNSLVDVLWGAYNPSAKLPYTIAKSPSDYGIEPNFVNTAEPPHPQIDYTEKLNIDYRHFLQAGIEPRYGFGYGLSYTQFGYANLAVVPTSSKSKRDEWQSESSFNGTDGNQLAGVKIGTSVDPALHAQRFSVEFTVTNTGPVDGCDVPQLYLAFPEAAGEPPKVLRGFERHNLQPGASVDVRYALSWYDLSIWDVVTQKWTVPEGEFRVVIGQSAFDEQLEMSFTP